MAHGSIHGTCRVKLWATRDGAAVGSFRSVEAGVQWTLGACLVPERRTVPSVGFGVSGFRGFQSQHADTIGRALGVRRQPPDVGLQQDHARRWRRAHELAGGASWPGGPAGAAGCHTGDEESAGVGLIAQAGEKRSGLLRNAQKRFTVSV